MNAEAARSVWRSFLTGGPAKPLFLPAHRLSKSSSRGSKIFQKQKQESVGCDGLQDKTIV